MRTIKRLSLGVMVLAALASNAEAQTPAPEAQTPPPQTQTPTPAPEAQTPTPEAQTPTPQTPTPAPETQTPAPETQTPMTETQKPSATGAGWRGRSYLHVSFGGQIQEQTFTDSATFDVFVTERAATAAGHSIGGGTLFDLSLGARVWKDLGVGIAYSRIRNKNDAIVSVRVPHPIFFGQSREATTTVTALEHSENAVHLQFVWMLQLTRKFQLAVMGGPSFFSVRQDVAGPLSRQDVSDPAPFTSVTITNVNVTEHKDSPVGGNIGVDGTYLVTRFIGVGGFVRYAGASLDLPTAAGVTRDEDLTAGGAQGGIGLRLRF